MSGVLCALIGGGGPAFRIVVPAGVTGNGSTSSITSDLATAEVVGGLGPFTFLWSVVNGDPNVSLTAPGNASTRFLATGMIPGGVSAATAICTVTDQTTGLSEQSAPVSGQLFREEV